MKRIALAALCAASLSAFAQAPQAVNIASQPGSLSVSVQGPAAAPAAQAPQSASIQINAPANVSNVNELVRPEMAPVADRSDSHEGLLRTLNKLEQEAIMRKAEEAAKPKEEKKPEPKVIVAPAMPLPPIVAPKAPVKNPNDDFRITMLGSYGFKGNLMAELRINDVNVHVQKGMKVPATWIVATVDGSSMTLVDQKVYKPGQAKYPASKVRTLYVSPAEAAAVWAQQAATQNPNQQNAAAKPAAPAQNQSFLNTLQPAAPAGAPVNLPPLPQGN